MVITMMMMMMMLMMMLEEVVGNYGDDDAADDGDHDNNYDDDDDGAPHAWPPRIRFSVQGRKSTPTRVENWLPVEASSALVSSSSPGLSLVLLNKLFSLYNLFLLAEGAGTCASHHGKIIKIIKYGNFT